MSKHTPGPWHVELDPPKYARIRSATRWIVAMVGNNENADAQTQADAKLIAAAPTLADALEQLVHSLFLEDPSISGPAVDNARAALRAAGRLP